MTLDQFLLTEMHRICHKVRRAGAKAMMVEEFLRGTAVKAGTQLS